MHGCYLPKAIRSWPRGPCQGEAARVRYAHIDIAGSMEAAANTLNDYQSKGLTGRPVRALIEFARRLAFSS